MTISNLSLTQIPACLPIVMKLLCVSLSRCLLLYVLFSVTGPVSVPISMYKSLSVCLPSVRPSAVCFFVGLRQSLCKPLSLSFSTARKSVRCDCSNATLHIFQVSHQLLASYFSLLLNSASLFLPSHPPPSIALPPSLFLAQALSPCPCLCRCFCVCVGRFLSLILYLWLSLSPPPVPTYLYSSLDLSLSVS